MKRSKMMVLADKETRSGDDGDDDDKLAQRVVDY